MSDLWIIVPSWEKFQHYKDRSPLWIKLYTELNSRDDWLGLTLADRGLLVTIWIEYARSRGRLRTRDVPTLSKKGRFNESLQRLNHAGFIRFSASSPASTEVEVEKKDLLENKRKIKDLLDDLNRGLEMATA